MNNVHLLVFRVDPIVKPFRHKGDLACIYVPFDPSVRKDRPAANAKGKRVEFTRGGVSMALLPIQVQNRKYFDSEIGIIKKHSASTPYNHYTHSCSAVKVLFGNLYFLCGTLGCERKRLMIK